MHARPGVTRRAAKSGRNPGGAVTAVGSMAQIPLPVVLILLRRAEDSPGAPKYRHADAVSRTAGGAAEGISQRLTFRASSTISGNTEPARAWSGCRISENLRTAARTIAPSTGLSG